MHRDQYSNTQTSITVTIKNIKYKDELDINTSQITNSDNNSINEVSKQQKQY